MRFLWILALFTPFSSPFSYLVVPSVEEETPERREARENRAIMVGHLQPNVIMKVVCVYVRVLVRVCVCVYSVILKVV